MKILYIITGLGLGGAEKVVCDLADQMSNLGHHVKIAYLTGKVLVHPKNINVDIIPLDLNNFYGLYLASKKYKKLIQDFQPDVVHAHMVHANIFTRINRIGCAIPKLICTAHNSNEGGRLRMIAYRLTNFLSDFNSNVSQEATESLISKGAFNKNNLTTVYNGIDLSKFKSFKTAKKNDEIMVLSVGRFNEQKDYPNLFKAIKILKDNSLIEKVKFYIAGDGELRPYLEKTIEDYGIKNNVVLLGKRSDIPELLNQADYFVLSSRHEGLPTVVIEAMACEKFVVATDCGGSAEILGETGILVPIEDSEALAKGLEQAISLTGDQIRNNGKLARERVEKLFSLEASINKWLALYEAK
ncbi:glycosyltransferase [Acinetobacter haemolyticus]|uniref:glycosyltransferase n=1 Tax=Acinetobacter haemolyticus TaxID=29430 RepID=UPI001372E457|nr:glycosyltransferase [Acinetobacter haemolyticus]NAR76419.1 glycosyltransferase [Acinetobacter haemolyticus]